MSMPQHLAPASNHSESLVVVEPRRGWHFVDLADLWRYHELLWILALRDIKVRYKQTVVGALWAILQPLSTMVIFTALFSLLGRTPVTESTQSTVHYAVLAFCGLLPWQLFSGAVTTSSDSLVANQALITKVYFPRIIILIAPIISNLVDFAIAFVILIGMLAWYGITPGWAVLTLPVFLLFAVATAFAISLWLSAMNAIYRDLRYAIPFLVRIGFYVSPVVYETQALIPEKWRAIYCLNPLVGVLEGFRWALLGTAAPPLSSFFISGTAVALLMVGGLIYFRRMERLFADRI